MKILFTIFALVSILGLKVKAQWIETSCSYGAYCFAVNGNNIFAGTFEGVYLSSNNGNTWTAMNTGIPANTWIKSLAVKGDTIFAGAVGDYGGYGVYLSLNNGGSWTAMNTGLADTSVFALAIKGDTIFAGTDSGLYLSSNNGQLWSATGLTGYWIAALAISGNNIFAATHNGVYLSTNNGSSWTAKNTGLTDSTNVDVLAISDTNIYAGACCAGGVYISSNNGSNWGCMGLPTSWVTSLAISGDTILAGAMCWDSPNGVLFHKYGSVWLNTGLINDSVNALKIIGDTLYAGTGNKIWELPLSEIITGIKEKNSYENDISVYPNPATDNLQIEINSEVRGENAELKIYDVVGNLVFEKSIATTKSTLDVSIFVNGVYVIKATTGEGVVVRKFVKE